MKIIFLKLFVIFIRILYAPMKLKKTKDKIVYLSRQSDEKSLDIELLSQAVTELSPHTEQVFRLKFLHDEKGLSLSYVFHVFGDMASIADASVVITDTYSIPVSCLHHKKSLKTVQLWHALGAVKKFGLQSSGMAGGRDSRVSVAMHMHENYDVVIAPSDSTAEFYKEAFGCSAKNIVIASLPRVDIILDGKSRKAEFLKLNPNFADKKLVLYVPTFRNTDVNAVKAFEKAFSAGGEYAAIVSVHPLSNVKTIPEFGFTGDFSTYDLMKIADCIVTDYSACAYEASLLGKRLFFFVPDIKEYSENQGLNFDPTAELKELSFTDENALYEAVLTGNYDFEALKNFSNKFVQNRGNDNARRLAEIVCSLIDENVKRK